MVLFLISTFRRCYLKFYSPVQSWVVTVNDLLLEYGLPSAYELFVNPPSKWLAVEKNVKAPYYSSLFWQGP